MLLFLLGLFCGEITGWVIASFLIKKNQLIINEEREENESSKTLR